MFRYIQPHSNPLRFTQLHSSFLLPPSDSSRFTKIYTDLLRQTPTDKSWREKGNCPKTKREKGRGTDSHFITDSTWITLRARTHGRDETTSRLGCSVLADSLPPNLRHGMLACAMELGPSWTPVREYLQWACKVLQQYIMGKVKNHAMRRKPQFFPHLQHRGYILEK